MSSALAAMLMLYGGSFGTGPERMFYVIAALSAAYAYLVQVRLGARVPGVTAAPVQRGGAR